MYSNLDNITFVQNTVSMCLSDTYKTTNLDKTDSKV